MATERQGGEKTYKLFKFDIKIKNVVYIVVFPYLDEEILGHFEFIFHFIIYKFM